MLRNLLLFSALVLTALPSEAATPANGAITDSQTSIEFSGGPYVVPNVTNIVQEAGEETVCEEGTPTCDIFRFEVNLTAANLDEDTIVVTVSWADSIPAPPANPEDLVPELPDYDLEMYDDETGVLVVQQASAANPEVMILPAGNRKYQLRIIPYAAMNEPYIGKVQFVKFEEEKGKSQIFFGGALGAGSLLLLTGLGAVARRKTTLRQPPPAL